MRVRLLGTAAGGGVPQWNCNCPNCAEARLGTGRVRPRTQSSVAISADGKRWFLLNASPDIARQIESFPPLQPAGFQPRGNAIQGALLTAGDDVRSRKSPRGTPIQGVLLTNADLDHTLGLLLLREGSAAAVHASRETEAALTNGLGLLPALRSFSRTKVFRASAVERRLQHADGSPSSLSCRAFAVPCKRPRFAARTRARKSNLGAAIGYQIRDLKTGGRLVYVPEILKITKALAASMNRCDLLLFDGTCWSDDEMALRGINGPTAAAMGHVPIHGESGSLQMLAKVTRPRKVYVHVNNTNPILFENSPENRRVLAAGWQIGEDGMEFEI